MSIVQRGGGGVVIPLLAEHYTPLCTCIDFSKNNLLFYGVPEAKDESADDLGLKIHQVEAVRDYQHIKLPI